MSIVERARVCPDEFVIWDVGLGAAANALAAIHACRALQTTLRLVSFDYTLEPLRLALKHPERLDYLRDDRELLITLMAHGRVSVTTSNLTLVWEMKLGDFPSRLAELSALPKPHAIFYDPFSPARNPAMWTQPVFSGLHRALDANRPCALATYSRSTMVRVALLTAGFFVGRGRASAGKEETTVAANALGLVKEPLDEAWRTRAERSSSAQPLVVPVYSQNRLSTETLDQLRHHPQFRRS